MTIAQYLLKPALLDRVPEIVITKNVDSIDASEMDTNFMGHDYVGSSRTILTDMAWLLRHHDAPDDRHGLDEKETVRGKYWFVLP